ncbi:MAG: hypothetical protein AB8B91_21875 [Rubripirellula sp.]
MNRHEFSHRSQSRRGITLPEVIGTLAVLLVVAVSAVKILGWVTDIGAENNRKRQDRISVERLAAVFRQDVRQSEDVKLRDGGWPLELLGKQTKDSDSKQISYDWNQQTFSIQRLVMQNNQRLAIERFEFSDRFSPRVEASDEMVTLLLRDHGTMPWVIEVSR